MTKITIRKVSAKDVEAIVGLQSKLMKSHMPYSQVYQTKKNRDVVFRKYLKTLLKSKKHLVNVAIEAGQAVGYSIVSIQDLPPVYKIDRQAMVNDLFIERKSRRKGVGARLLRFAERWARKNGMKYIGLETDARNAPAIALYKKSGFGVYRYKMHKAL